MTQSEDKSMQIWKLKSVKCEKKVIYSIKLNARKIMKNVH